MSSLNNIKNTLFLLEEFIRVGNLLASFEKELEKSKKNGLITKKLEAMHANLKNRMEFLEDAMKKPNKKYRKPKIIFKKKNI